MSAPSDPLRWIDDSLAQLESADLRRRRFERTSSQGAEIIVAGLSGQQRLINFGANDYLDLASDPRLRDAATEAAAREGWGAGASPLVTGYSSAHAHLERDLAEWLDAEAALVFPSGFAANSGVIPALVDRDDAIFADQKNHASLIDGCRLSRAETHIYPHLDVATLTDMLSRAGAYRRRLIVTDSLFSMDGDLAPLDQLADIAQRFDAMLMIDEAHATGVFGPYGEGLAAQLGVAQRVHIRVGTLSKGIGSAGGFVAGRRSLIEWLLNRVRSYVFSTADPPAVAGASRAAIRIIRAEPERREKLLATAARVRDELAKQGWRVGGASQIIPIVIGDPATTMRLAAALRNRGLFVPGIRPPSVPSGESLLRISLSQGHTPQMLERLTSAMAEFGHLSSSSFGEK